MGQNISQGRLNIHGAIDLEVGRTVMKEVLTVEAMSTIFLLMAIDATYPRARLVLVFLNNPRYHHAKVVQAWFAWPDCRSSCTSCRLVVRTLNPIERLLGLMHRNITYDKYYASFRGFSAAAPDFLRQAVRENGMPSAIM